MGVFNLDVPNLSGLSGLFFLSFHPFYHHPDEEFKVI
jgi:hypothetical protein